MPDAIIVVDAEGRLLMANGVAEQSFGPPGRPGEPLSAGLRAIFPVAQALAGEHAVREVRVGLRVLSAEAWPLRDAGGCLRGAVCQAYDADETRRQQGWIRLAAGAAHQIRNPLTSVRGLIQLLAERGAGQAEYFEILLREIDQIDRITRNLLLMARPYRLERATVDVEPVVGSVMALYQAELERSGIACEIDCESRLRANLDPVLLRHLLLNLVSNAVDAMRDGGRLRVAVRRLEAGRLQLEVADTGRGVAKEVMDRLFEPFFTTKEAGTGLGLALCRMIAEAHGGEIRVASQPGEGTRVTVTLHAPAPEADGPDLG